MHYSGNFLESHLPRYNLFINLNGLVCKEGRIPGSHLVYQNSQSPPVYCFIVTLITHTGKHHLCSERMHQSDQIYSLFTERSQTATVLTKDWAQNLLYWGWSPVPGTPESRKASKSDLSPVLQIQNLLPNGEDKVHGFGHWLQTAGEHLQQPNRNWCWCLETYSKILTWM